MVEFSKLVKERRTVHHYLPQKVDKQILIKTLELGLWAPNHKLTFPMRYRICDEDTQLKIRNLALKLKPNSDMKKINKKILNPSLIFLGQVRSNDSAREREDYATCAMAIQNMQLYLWSLGIGSKWSTGKLTRHEDLYEIFEQNQEKILCIGFLWVGHFDEELKIPERPPLQKILI